MTQNLNLSLVESADFFEPTEAYELQWCKPQKSWLFPDKFEEGFYKFSDFMSGSKKPMTALELAQYCSKHGLFIENRKVFYKHRILLNFSSGPKWVYFDSAPEARDWYQRNLYFLKTV